MRYLLTKGINAEEVYREAGVDPGVVYSPDQPIPQSKFEEFWLAAVNAARDPDLGLHVGEATNPRPTVDRSS